MDPRMRHARATEQDLSVTALNQLGHRTQTTASDQESASPGQTKSNGARPLKHQDPRSLGGLDFQAFL